MGFQRNDELMAVSKISGNLTEFNNKFDVRYNVGQLINTLPYILLVLGQVRKIYFVDDQLYLSIRHMTML